VPAPVEFGSYLVYEQLGVGGMASVHIAESRGLRKRVALKRLLPHAADSPELVRSFIHEARLVGYLKHTNIAQTYDFGKVGDTYFIAMELVPGPTLAQLIRQCKATVGIVPFPVTLNILCQACDALDYAHTLCDEKGTPLGLIHRDVSPPNIIVSNTGTVKLIDFGVAKLARSSLQTQVGTVKGKFSYMAPEYLGGQLDSRVDLWALGAVAYELLTNETLFDAPDDLGVLEKVRSKPIPPPSRRNPDVPRDLDAVVLTALERNPAQRWQTAKAMRNALSSVATDFTTGLTSAQVIEWIEWAFTQEPGKERHGVSQLIQLLEKPSRPGVRAINAASARTVKLGGDAAAEDTATRPARPANATKPAKPAKPAKPGKPDKPSKSDKPDKPSAAPEERPRMRGEIVYPFPPGSGAKRWPWLLLLLVAVAIGAAIYLYGVPPALLQSF
jgi:serine/threonine protein kinase